MTQIQMAVFDMAGTTVNENNVVYKTLRRSINKEGFDLSLQTVLLHGAGKEKKQAIRDILIQTEGVREVDALSSLIYLRFKNALQTAYERLDVQPYEGVVDLFKELQNRNIKVILNTGYDSATANSLLKKLNWKVGRDIDGLVTASDVNYGRPHPDMIFKAMALFNLKESRQVLKAGDSIVDIEEGKNAGCGLTIGVVTGAQTEEELLTASPDYIFDRLDKILDII